MINLIFILFLIVAYLIGSIPTGYLMCKIKKGVDIRKFGSGATSATNTARLLGWKWGAFVGVFDFLKGVIPAYLALHYLTSPWEIIIVALMPMVGHIFPVWLKFHGGRGASTFFGAAIVLTGPKFFLFFIIWILILFLSKIMSLTNLLFAWILSILFLILYPLPYFVFGILGSSLLTFALRDNIKRLKAGTEPKITLKL